MNMRFISPWVLTGTQRERLKSDFKLRKNIDYKRRLQQEALYARIHAIL